MASAYATYQQNVEQKSKEARSELGQVIQRISDLSRESGADIKSGKEQVVGRQPRVGLDSERVALAQRAADIIREIPQDVSAHECYLVAQAFYDSDRYAESVEIAKIGTSKKVDWKTHPRLHRIEGGALFGQGKLDEARKAMQAAIDTAPTGPHDERIYSQAYSENFWAIWERKVRACDEARQHFKNAKLMAGLLASESYRISMNEYVGDAEPACR
ncbi:hypothetical protein [Micromonospora sp. NPDC023633]|uniref:hypothetical protein n=1 Tax=Micromonospora sp. NPDC023633 TaxID=3154320 RepID=UPI0033E4006B